jgi:hypothetical protein
MLSGTNAGIHTNEITSAMAFIISTGRLVMVIIARSWPETEKTKKMGMYDQHS